MRNPFVFKYVRQLRHDRVDDSGPCVLLATPSMLQVDLLLKPQSRCIACISLLWSKVSVQLVLGCTHGRSAAPYAPSCHAFSTPRSQMRAHKSVRKYAIPTSRSVRHHGQSEP